MKTLRSNSFLFTIESKIWFFLGLLEQALGFSWNFIHYAKRQFLKQTNNKICSLNASSSKAAVDVIFLPVSFAATHFF